MSTTSFQIEYEQLLEKVDQGLDQLLFNLEHFNRNLETVNIIGKEFAAPAKQWRNFHTAMVTLDANQTVELSESLQRSKETNTKEDEKEGSPTSQLRPPAPQ